MRAKRLLQIYFIRCSQIGLVIVAAWLLSGCNYPASKEDLPPCLPGDLTTPATPLGPGDHEVIDTLSPMYVWEWSADCDPDEFVVEVFSPTSVLPAVISERVAGTSRGWDMPGDLQPGSTYSWHVTPYIGGAAGTVSSRSFFITGPQCLDPSAADYPVLTLLAPPDGTEITELSPIHVSDDSEWPSVSVEMVWDDPSLCNPDSYLMQVSTSPIFPNGRTLDFPQDEGTAVLFFFPPDVEGFPFQDCTLYYWHVRADLGGDAYGPWSDTWTFFIHTGGLICSTIPVITPVIPLPVSPPLSTPVAPAMASGIQNTNCRTGPSRIFSIVSTLYEGQSSMILGRTEDSTWWLIDHPELADSCWVWAGSVEVSGDVSLVPVVAPPPTPEVPAPPEPKPQDVQDEDQQEPGGQEGCWLIDNQHPNGYCAPRPCGPNDYPGNACVP